jgi:hypothetical protein
LSVGHVQLATHQNGKGRPHLPLELIPIFRYLICDGHYTSVVHYSMQLVFFAVDES